jgi:hypothetical protein
MQTIARELTERALGLSVGMLAAGLLHLGGGHVGRPRTASSV